MTQQFDRFGQSVRIASYDAVLFNSMTLHACPAALFAGFDAHASHAAATMYAVAWDAAQRQVARDATMARIARSN